MQLRKPERAKIAELIAAGCSDSEIAAVTYIELADIARTRRRWGRIPAPAENPAAAPYSRPYRPAQHQRGGQ